MKAKEIEKKNKNAFALDHQLSSSDTGKPLDAVSPSLTNVYCDRFSLPDNEGAGLNV
jgi:hypothetical protein